MLLDSTPTFLPDKKIKSCEYRWNDASFQDIAFEQENIRCPENIQRAVLKRRREFFYGRLCARNAIRELIPGFDSEIPSNEDRSPRWPTGIVGSISHTNNFAIAVCSSSESFLSLGVDVEMLIKPETAQNIQSQIVSEAELKIPGAEDWAFEEKLTLAFSAKESLFKALHPLVKTFFGFDYARLLSVDAREQAFKITLEKTINDEWCSGRCVEGVFSRHVNNAGDVERITSLIAVENPR